MDAQQRRVYAAAAQLRELLNDKCPRCQAVFLDFTGCCALTCPRCNCGFCAWCLQDCGADAHQHVAGCRSNLAPGRSVFATEALWHQGRVKRRHEAAWELLSSLPREGGVARLVVAATRAELEEVGLGELVAAYSQQ